MKLINMQVWEYLTAFLPLQDRGNYKNFAGPAILVEVHAF